MAAPSTPTNFNLQSGDGNAFLSWDITATATSYVVQRSPDGVTYTTRATITGSPLKNYYLDEGESVDGPEENTTYFYKVAAANGDGTSSYTDPQNTIITAIGIVSLGYLRLTAQQRCDRVNSTFVSLTEWNKYITESRKELYDILTLKFGDDYYVATPYTYTLGGNQNLYPLPADFYKLLGVEIALNPGDSLSWVTLKKFEFIQRNRWNYPNVYTFYGVTNLRYRLNGNNIMIVPVPSGGQTLRIWYAPRPSVLMADTDIVDGVSGWEEYIIIDAAIKALAKEESDVSVFMAQKKFMLERIEQAAENRDAGEPEQVSDTKSRNFGWGDDDGSYGGSGGYF